MSLLVEPGENPHSRFSQFLRALLVVAPIPLYVSTVALVFQGMMLGLAAVAIPFLVLTLGTTWSVLRGWSKGIIVSSALSAMLFFGAGLLIASA